MRRATDPGTCTIRVVGRQMVELNEVSKISVPSIITNYTGVLGEIRGKPFEYILKGVDISVRM